MRNSILRNPNVVRSKNVAAKHCTVVHKARYVFPLDVVRVNDFRVRNLQKSRDTLTDPILSCRTAAMIKPRSAEQCGPISSNVTRVTRVSADVSLTNERMETMLMEHLHTCEFRVVPCRSYASCVYASHVRDSF